jgi:hypothetical protein
MNRAVKIKQVNMHSAVVEVDGKDIAPLINAYSLSAQADGDGASLWVSFSPAVLPEFDGPAEVEISEDLHEALVSLGWTPPAKEDAP